MRLTDLKRFKLAGLQAIKLVGCLVGQPKSYLKRIKYFLTFYYYFHLFPTGDLPLSTGVPERQIALFSTPDREL